MKPYMIIALMLALLTSCKSSVGGPVGNSEIMERKSSATHSFALRKGACLLHLDLYRKESGFGLALSSAPTSSCHDTDYNTKIIGYEKLVKHIHDKGWLSEVTRLTPGPGPDLCKPPIIHRLIKAANKMLSEGEGGGQLKYGQNLIERANVSKELRTIFNEFSLSIEIKNIEGIVLEDVGNVANIENEGLNFKLPCNAMIAYSVSGLQPDQDGHQSR